jgi:hypothetical protein
MHASTPAPARATHAPDPRTTRTARIWNLVLVLNGLAALIIQVALVLTGGPDPNTGETVASVGVATRMVQTVSFFTVQSNLLVLAAAATLVVDPHRDGRFWRVLRLDAILGITVTGLVFDLILIRYVDPTGWQLVATIGFHYVAPWATLLGWLLLGPWPRIDRRTVAWAFVWPVLWIVGTFVRGAVTGWYPYPFLDVPEVGYPAALRATAGVLAVSLVLVAAFAAIDRARGRRGRDVHRRTGPAAR